MNSLKDIAACMMFLTRIPLNVAGLDRERLLAESAWAFPVIGALVGGVGGIVYAIAVSLSLAPLIAGALGIAAMVALTGALHEDGFADTVDGLGGGADRDSRLRIMGDSRIGTFGAAALILSLVGRSGAMEAISDPATVISALVVAGAASRAAMVAVMNALPPARKTGLGADAGKPSQGVTVGAAGIAVLIAITVLPFGVALVTLAVAAAGAGAVAWTAHRRIGGMTGDILGAAQQVAEIGAIIALAGLLGAAG